MTTEQNANSSSAKVAILETNQGWGELSTVILSDKTLEDLGLYNGDIVEIIGTRTTVAYCHPERSLYSFGPAPSSVQKDSIRMGAITRHNAGVKLGDTVTVRKTCAKVAGKVYLLPMYRSQSAYGVTPEHLKKRSSNSIVVMVGDNMVAGFHGGRQILQVVGIAGFAGEEGTLLENMEEYRSTIMQKKATGELKVDEQSLQEALNARSLTPFVIYPQATEFEIISQDAVKPIRGFPAFWVDVGLGGRTDPMHNKFLSLRLLVSHYDGFVNADFEVKNSPKTVKPQQPAPFDFGKFLQGLQDAAEGKPGVQQQDSTSALAAIHSMMDSMGDINSSAAPYIEEAAKIMEAANEEWRMSPHSISPSDVKYRILKRWTEL